MNQLFRRDDTGRGYVQGCDTFDMRLAFANFVRINQAQSLDAIVVAAPLQCREFQHLMSICGHYQLSAVTKGNFVLRAEFIRKAIAFYAKPCLQGALRVINAGVLHSAVARAGSHTQLGKLLDEKDVLPTLSNVSGTRAAAHPAANN